MTPTDFTRLFQERFGLTPDGIPGKQTLAKLDEIAPVRKVAGLKDEGAFFASIRTAGLFAGMKQSQVDGIHLLLKRFAAANWSLGFASYGLATAYWETARSMEPVAEGYYLGARAEAFRKTLRYYPWYGRGYPQTTWERNYRKADEALGLDGQLLHNPDLMLTADVAAPTMVRGMAEGWFTGVTLADTLPEQGPASFEHFKQARKIINGTDKDDEIAEVALKFQAALGAGGWA